MTFEYLTDYLSRHGHGASMHNLENWDEKLNSYGKRGYRLVHVGEATIGAMLVFERTLDKAPQA